MNDLQVSFVLSQSTRLTDGRTESLGNTMRCIACSRTVKIVRYLVWFPNESAQIWE